MWKSTVACLRSWQTTSVAFATALMVILQTFIAICDTDPLTKPDWNSVAAVLALAWIGFRARDADKTDQQSGLRPEK